MGKWTVPVTAEKRSPLKLALLVRERAPRSEVWQLDTEAAQGRGGEGAWSPMGIPIWNDGDIPLKTLKGYFSASTTEHVVGSAPEAVFESQPEAQRLLFPVLSFDAGVVNEDWADTCLHFVCGGLGEGGVFFRVLPGRRLSYLGTAAHPTPSHLAFAPPMRILFSALLARRPQRPVHPGFVHFVEYTPGESGSDDDGYARAPVVYLGGDSEVEAPPDRAPSCLDCGRAMRFVGELSCGQFAEDLFDVPLSLFYCHACGVQCCMDDVDVVVLSD